MLFDALGDKRVAGRVARIPTADSFCGRIESRIPGRGAVVEKGAKLSQEDFPGSLGGA